LLKIERFQPSGSQYEPGVKLLKRDVLFDASRSFVKQRPRLRAFLLLLYAGVIGARHLIHGSYDALYFFLVWFQPGNRGIGAEALGSTIVMLSVSDMRIDPRIEREARALALAGFEVVVIWPSVSPSDNERGGINWGPGITFKRLPFAAGEFVRRFPGYCGREMLLAALQFKPLAFHGHDLSSGLIALTAAEKTGAYAVVDFHEWFSENVSWRANAWQPHRFPQKQAYQWLERQVLRHASEIITVCDSIADAMKVELGGRRPVVIRNIPEMAIAPSREYAPLKQQLGLPDSTFALLYQGGIGPTRLIEPIIESLVDAPGCVLVIRGPSLDMFGPDYLSLARRIGVEDRVILAPAVPSRDVVAAAVGADAGIYTVAALCRNFIFALPNKVFEYLAADLPVLVAHYPETKRLVCENEVGFVFDPYDPNSIADAINRLMNGADLRGKWAANARAALSRMNAQKEWQKVVSIYENMLRTK
jgi:glycosyltransferase involved in cell wall biosynthesis